MKKEQIIKILDNAARDFSNFKLIDINNIQITFDNYVLKEDEILDERLDLYYRDKIIAIIYIKDIENIK